MQPVRKLAAQVYPSERQYRFLRQPFYAFIHFTVNTFTGLEWGTGKEDPAIFNPVALDCDSWVEAVKSAGMSGIVLTAKHHDGFCLWQTDTTFHSVKSSKWKDGKGDVVKECAEACKRGGIRFGFYLSPWDRNCSLYGTEAYNDFYRRQLTELLTNYGDIFYVWFDGACGEGPNGRVQHYDFESYVRLVRDLQPDACIFHDAGPDIRWIGNESGKARNAEWAVVPAELCPRAETQILISENSGTLNGIYNSWPDLGSEQIIRHAKGLSFCPAETDMSIRNGWFYHPQESPHSIERLFLTYISSIGGNSTFNLNIPPMPNGRFDPRDIKRLQELGDVLRNTFGSESGTKQIICVHDLNEEQCVYDISLETSALIRYIVLEENLKNGQLIEQFQIRICNEFGRKTPVYFGTTVGNRKICDLGEDLELSSFDIFVISARGKVKDLTIRLYQ